MFEVQDARHASAAGDKAAALNDKKNLVKATDPHIPQFAFKQYPDLVKEFDDSPRKVEDIWVTYKKKSLEVPGATALRQDSEFLDQII